MDPNIGGGGFEIGIFALQQFSAKWESFFQFSNVNFLLVQFPLHHATSSLFEFSPFKYDDASELKTFMGGPFQHS